MKQRDTGCHHPFFRLLPSWRSTQSVQERHLPSHIFGTTTKPSAACPISKLYTLGLGDCEPRDPRNHREEKTPDTFPYASGINFPSLYAPPIRKTLSHHAPFFTTFENAI
jgi:hypothetical protein